MSPTLFDSENYWTIQINPDLEYVYTENRKKNIKWNWGRDENDKYKIMYAFYPKSFSESDMHRILSKYFNCPNCTIGRKSLKFKYRQNNSKIMALENFSFIRTIEKIPKLGALIAKSETSRNIATQWFMQGLAHWLSNPIDLTFEVLGAKLLKLIIGIGGTYGLTKLNLNSRLKDELITFLANWGSSIVDPTADEQIRMIKDAKRMKNAILGRNYYAARDILIKRPNQIKIDLMRIRNALMEFGNSFGKSGLIFKNIFNAFGKIGKKGRFWRVPMTHGATIKTADDYKYIDTSKRFQDVSEFSPKFLGKQRFKMVGEDFGY